MVIVQIWLGYQPFISLISLDYHSFIEYKWNISQISLIYKGVPILQYEKKWTVFQTASYTNAKGTKTDACEGELGFLLRVQLQM